MSSGNSLIKQNESRDAMPQSFIGIFSIYTDKTATKLESQYFVVYTIHFTFLNVSVQLRSFLIYHGYNLVGFCPAGLQGSYLNDGNYHSITKKDNYDDFIVIEYPIIIDEQVRLTYSSMGRDYKMTSIHDKMDMVLASKI